MTETLLWFAAASAYTPRRGIVRADGKAVVDDDGPFHPLGITFFWALYGEKFERDRLLANLDFIARYKFDYIRILAEVGWPGEEIDPNWPDYEQLLGQLIDDAYARGLRVEITVLGGGGHDPMGVATKVVRVVNSGRQHKIIAIECSNEGLGANLATLEQMARYFRATTPNLIALTSIGYLDGVQEASVRAGATLMTAHIDRNSAEHGWRQVRQGWDFKDYPGVVDSNEPPGPNSSVATNNSPLELAMMRATGVLAGGAMYVLHVGDMVTGREDPARNRRPNIWQVEGIDAICRTVRGVDQWLPARIENWEKFNNFWNGHPLTTDAFWGDGAVDHGVNRNYAAIDGDRFVMVVNGVLREVTFTARQACHVEAASPVTGIVISTNLAAGQTWTLPGRDDTMAGFLVTGQFR